MPKVPTYQLGQIQSQPVNAAQNISAPAGAFGARTAAALIGAGQDLNKVATDNIKLQGLLQDRHDKAVLREADNNGQEFLRELLTLDFFQSKGRNALDRQEEVEDKINSYYKGIGENLPQRIQGSFSDTSSVRVNNALNKVSSYAMSEFVSWENETSDARVSLFVNQAADNAGDLGQIAIALGAGAKEIKEMAARGGWSSDQLELKTKEFTSEAHKAVIERFLSSDQPSRAELYYKSLPKEAILGTVKDDLENAMLKNGVKKRSQRAADTIMNEGLPQTEAMKKARQTQSGPLREAVVALVKSRYTENDTIRSRYKRDQVDAAWKFIVSGKPVTELTAQQTASLTGPQLSAMMNYAQLKLEGQEPAQNKQMWAEFNALYYKAADGDKEARDKILGMEMYSEFVNHFDNTHFDEAIRMQGTLVVGKGPASGDSTKTVNRILSNKSAIDQSLKVLFSKKTTAKFNSSQIAFQSWMYSEVGRRVDAYAKEQDIKTVPDEVRNKIIYNLTSSWTKENRFIDDTYNLKDIPREDRDYIIQRRQSQGLDIDSSSVIQDWLIATGEL